MSIRPFRNSDLPQLLEIWIQHFSALGRPPIVSLSKFEQAVVARIFFQPSNLLVNVGPEGPTGWIAFAPCQHDSTKFYVCALCFLPTDDQAGKELLLAVETRCIEAGRSRIQVGLIRDDTYGYAGLDPLGHGTAISLLDQRTISLLKAAEFVAEPEFVQMVATTFQYRPPVNRDAIQLRRNARLTQTPHVYHAPRQAAAMSHMDVEKIQLVNASGEELAAISLWCSDPEAEVMDPAMAIIDLGACHERGTLTAAECYLIGATLQRLEQQRVTNVEIVVDCKNTELISQLETLKFQAGQRGTAWQKNTQ
ncbi:hypothetical protein N9D23_08265 [Rubripirellula sp.]|nr:hypothetical protein [Planctomycetaceae bacterium]MDA9858103.1 hypothetical protein [Rubripirellula sp.]